MNFRAKNQLCTLIHLTRFEQFSNTVVQSPKNKVWNSWIPCSSKMGRDALCRFSRKAKRLKRCKRIVLHVWQKMRPPRSSRDEWRMHCCALCPGKEIIHPFTLHILHTLLENQKESKGIEMSQNESKWVKKVKKSQNKSKWIKMSQNESN